MARALEAAGEMGGGFARRHERTFGFRAAGIKRDRFPN
jgi:hypothetical protein